MKRFLLSLITVVLCLFVTSCGNESILDVKEVAKSELTTPLFLAFDNSLDEPVKKIWAFNEKEAVKGTITVVDDNLLRFKTEWYFGSWSYSGRTLTLTGDENKKTYDLTQVTVLGYKAIAFGTAYVCVPSTNQSLSGVRYEEDWYNRGLTSKAFWEAMRASGVDGSSVDFKLQK